MESESHIRRKLFHCGILIFIGALPPILSLTIDYRPDGEDITTWFQRSGAVLVIFSILAEIKLSSLHSTIIPGDHTIVDPGTYSERYKPIYIALTLLAALLAILGTIITSYGDLLL